MYQLKVTEWDSGKEPGSLAFELTDNGVICYVIRHSDGTYTHMFSDFTEDNGFLSENTKSAREITVASYIATNNIRPTWER